MMASNGKQKQNNDQVVETSAHKNGSLGTTLTLENNFLSSIYVVIFLKMHYLDKLKHPSHAERKG